MATTKIPRYGTIELTKDQTTILRNAFHAHKEYGGAVFAQPMCIDFECGTLHFKVYGAKDALRINKLLVEIKDRDQTKAKQEPL